MSLKIDAKKMAASSVGDLRSLAVGANKLADDVEKKAIDQDKFDAGVKSLADSLMKLANVPKVDETEKDKKSKDDQKKAADLADLVKSMGDAANNDELSDDQKAALSAATDALRGLVPDETSEVLKSVVSAIEKMTAAMDEMKKGSDDAGADDDKEKAAAAAAAAKKADDAKAGKEEDVTKGDDSGDDDDADVDWGTDMTKQTDKLKK